MEKYRQLEADFLKLADIVAGRLAALMRGEALPVLEGRGAPRQDDMPGLGAPCYGPGGVGDRLNNLVQTEQILDAFFRDPGRGSFRSW